MKPVFPNPRLRKSLVCETIIQPTQPLQTRTMANEAYVALSFRGQFEPGELTARVGFVPTKTWRRGERDAERDIPKVSGWSIVGPTISGDSIDLFALADELVLPLADKAEDFREMAREHDAVITVHMVIFISVLESIPTPAIGLSARAVSVLEKLGASLDIDTYRSDIYE